jgi:hypothetical protein
MKCTLVILVVAKRADIPCCSQTMTGPGLVDWAHHTFALAVSTIRYSLLYFSGHCQMLRRMVPG